MATSTGATGQDEMRSRIQSWLQEEGWKTQFVSGVDMAWGLRAQDENGRVLIIGQKPGRQDQIILQATIDVSPSHQQRLAQLPRTKREEFLWSVRFELLHSGVLFQGVADPLQQIVLNQRIYYDAMTKDAFLQRITQILNALVLVLWSMAREFSEPPPEQPHSSRLH